MVMFIDVGKAHCPEFGIKLNVNVPGTVVFIVPGTHFPEIPGLSFDGLGKLGGGSP